jgi:hypothetical protein
MDIPFIIESPLSREYIELWNTIIEPRNLDKDSINILYEISIKLLYKVWNSENLDRTIDNINNNLPSPFSNSISQIIYNCTTYLSIPYNNNYITLLGLNTQCMFMAYKIFISYIIKIVDVYCQNNNLEYINTEILKMAYNDKEELFIHEIDYGPLRELIKNELLMY